MNAINADILVLLHTKSFVGTKFIQYNIIPVVLCVIYCGCITIDCEFNFCDSLTHNLHVHYSDVIMSTMTSQMTWTSIAYSAVSSGADEREHRRSESLAFVREIQRWPVNSPQRTSDAKNVSIWWRHHDASEAPGTCHCQCSKHIGKLDLYLTKRKTTKQYLMGNSEKFIVFISVIITCLFNDCATKLYDR